MRNIFSAILILTGFTGFSQEVLVPYRVGDLFGLSDIKGAIKVKPAYDYIEPIGEGYYKYANYTQLPDTVHWTSGRIEIRQKTDVETGVFYGKSRVIQNSKHRHFTVVKEAMLIGSEESYISKNSNFYNLKGKKLLESNVEKFRFLNTSDLGKNRNSQIAIYAEHNDKTASIYLYDCKKQKMLAPMLDKVKNIKLDRNASTEEVFVFSYQDDQYRSYKMSIYYDENKKTFVKIPYAEVNAYSYKERYNNSREIMGEAPVSPVPEPPRSGNDEMKPSSSISKREIPKKVYSFIKLNDSLIKYNETEIMVAPGEKIFFAERGAKNQRYPLIFTAGKKRGLIFSDSLRSQKLFDSLRYIKNQYGPFTSSYTYLYLAGNINIQTGKWQFGVIDANGKEIIPISYEYLSPNLPEIYLEDKNDSKPDTFSFRQPYNYSNDKNALLTLYKEGVFLARKNGKSGVINLYDSILLPFEYDHIWKNGFSFLKTVRVNEDFYVYKKGSMYGVFNFKINKIKYDTGPKFPKVPVYAYLNYLGVKGFNMYNLAEPAHLFFCLAGDDGTIYYSPK